MRGTGMNWKRLTILLALGALALAVGSCTWSKTKRNYDKAASFVFDVRPTTSELYEEEDTPIIDLNYEAAVELADTMEDYAPLESPVFVERFTNVTDSSDASPFGTVLAEQVAAGLVQEGVHVTAGQARLPEPTLGEQETETTFLGEEIPLRPAVLTGTYMLGKDVIYVSATITALQDDAVLSAYHWTLPVNDNMRVLLPQLEEHGSGMTPSVSTSF